MQINPQVNTSIIRSVTLRHCPRGMCEFHLVCPQIDDNSCNQVPSESVYVQALKCGHSIHTVGNMLITCLTLTVSAPVARLLKLRVIMSTLVLYTFLTQNFSRNLIFPPNVQGTN